MNSLKDEILKLKAQKKANEEKKFTRQSDIIEEKIKENKANETILKNFDDIEKERETWFKDQKIIFQPSTTFKNSHAEFFNFKKCEKKPKQNRNKLNPSIDTSKPTEIDEKVDGDGEFNSLADNLKKAEETKESKEKELKEKEFEKKYNDVLLTKEVIFDRLRRIKAPVTLFGEIMKDRQRRLYRLENGESEELIYGTKGRKEYVEEKIEIKNDNNNDDNEIDYDNLDDNISNFDDKNDNNMEFDTFDDNNLKKWVNKTKPNNAIEFHKDNNTHSVKKVVNTKKFSKEFKNEELYTWYQKIFQEWESELTREIDMEMRKTSEGRQRVGIFRQCKRYMKPLMKLFKTNTTPSDILDKLFEVMVYCMDRDYVKANDKYIEIAIGNAPWPVGVTMVGIHERSGRSKIYNSQVAHILNDETQKRYLQSVKRIMSVCQRIYATTPSKSVYS